MNSSKLSRPSKSRSIEPKKSSTSSLNFQMFIRQTIFHFSHLVVGTPLELRTLSHSWSGKCNYVLVLIRKQACKPWRWACIQSKLTSQDKVQWFHWFDFDQDFWILCAGPWKTLCLSGFDKRFNWLRPAVPASHYCGETTNLCSNESFLPDLFVLQIYIESQKTLCLYFRFDKKDSIGCLDLLCQLSVLIFVSPGEHSSNLGKIFQQMLCK